MTREEKKIFLLGAMCRSIMKEEFRGCEPCHTPLSVGTGLFLALCARYIERPQVIEEGLDVNELSESAQELFRFFKSLLDAAGSD